MDLVQLLILILIIAVIFWLLSRYVTPALPAPWGTVLLAVVAIVVVLWLASASGLLGGLRSVRVGWSGLPPVAAEVLPSDEPSGGGCPCGYEPEPPAGDPAGQDYPVPG